MSETLEAKALCSAIEVRRRSTLSAFVSATEPLSSLAHLAGRGHPHAANATRQAPGAENLAAVRAQGAKRPQTRILGSTASARQRHSAVSDASVLSACAVGTVAGMSAEAGNHT